MDQSLLIVEDSGDVRKLLRITLGYGLYRIHEASTAEDGLVIARAVHPDVIVLDVMLGGAMNGFQLCRQLRQVEGLQRSFVVMVTARGTEADREEGRASGADAYVIKPFMPNNLIEIIESRRRDPAPAQGIPSA